MSFLDESAVGVLIAAHLGTLLPRYQEAGRIVRRLAACKEGSAEAAELASHVAHMLSVGDDVLEVRLHAKC